MLCAAYLLDVIGGMRWLYTSGGYTSQALLLSGTSHLVEGTSLTALAPSSVHLVHGSSVSLAVTLRSVIMICSGKYANQAGMPSCTSAPLGTMVPSKGADNYTWCPPGTWQDVLGRSHCYACERQVLWIVHCTDWALQGEV